MHRRARNSAWPETIAVLVTGMFVVSIFLLLHGWRVRVIPLADAGPPIHDGMPWDDCEASYRATAAVARVQSFFSYEAPAVLSLGAIGALAIAVVLAAASAAAGRIAVAAALVSAIALGVLANEGSGGVRSAVDVWWTCRTWRGRAVGGGEDVVTLSGFPAPIRESYVLDLRPNESARAGYSVRRWTATRPANYALNVFAWSCASFSLTVSVLRIFRRDDDSEGD